MEHLSEHMQILSGEWLLPYLVALGYALPRLLGIFSMLPLFNRQALPGIIRSAIAASLALTLVPTLLEPVQAAERSAGIALGIILKEGLLGMAIGFMLALPIWAMEAMGDIIDNQRGASIAQTLSPMTGHDTSPLGDLFAQSAVIFLLVSGAFLLILSAVYDSYALWPVFSWTPRFGPDTPGFLLGLLDTLMRLAVLMGAPVLIAMFLSEVGLALISRFAPQLQVFFLAMPIKSGLAILVLAIYAVTLFDVLSLELDGLGQRVLRELAAMLG